MKTTKSEHQEAHVQRLLEATSNLYNRDDSICMKCHDMDKINCVFCYCPLYDIECGGSYTILSNGVKDCSNCIKPHTKEFVRKYFKLIP